MVVVFSNIKGGVGKSTLCTELAHYWTTKGLKVVIYDADPQHSIARQRDVDKKTFSKNNFKFEVYPVNVTDQTDRKKLLATLQASSKVVMIDLKAGMDLANTEIAMIADFIIVPFQFEAFTVRSSGNLLNYLQRVQTINPKMKAQTIYVPNNIERPSKDDIRKWKEYEEVISQRSHLATRILANQHLKKRNTAYMSNEELLAVDNSFESITNIIFPNL